MATSTFLLLLALTATVSAYGVQPPKQKEGMCIRRFFIALACNPGETINTCANNDFNCPGTQKCCRVQRCVTACEEPAGPKPGQCPPPSAVEVGFSSCEVDTDCGENNANKCCRNRQGNLRCAPPRTTTPGGRCPTLPPDQATICIVTCNNDDECPGDKICCNVGCRKTCESPVYG